jgi:hypothetical protein
MLEHEAFSIDYVRFFCGAVATRAKVLLEYLLERHHAGYVSPDKAMVQDVARGLPLC